jgi:Na+-transporting methylmalonyl-CoA/oxaloacetate decarboxylase gamma subunit
VDAFAVVLLVLIVLVVLIVAIGGYLYRRRPKQRERKQIKALVIACRGDQALAERLMFAEMQRTEGISYADAARSALASLARDRR